MKIDYQKHLNKNLINVFKDVIKDFEKIGVREGHHLYVTFDTNNRKVKIPKFLKDKYPKEMTIVIQYEYWNLKVKKNSFSISLSFNNSTVDLDVPYDCIKSFVDPYANFGLKLNNDEQDIKTKKQNVTSSDKKNNVIKFKKKLN